jgi:DNA-binding CsgD family transcriptional regulator
LAIVGDELARQSATGGTRRYAPYVETAIADVYVEQGRWDEALEMCEAQLADAAESRTAPWFRQAAAEILTRRGDLDRAGPLLDAITEAIGPGNPVIDRLWAINTTLVVGRARGDVESVREAIDEALALSADPQHNPLLWSLLVTALAAEADAAEAARASGAANDLERAVAHGTHLSTVFDAAAGAAGAPDGWPPSLQAYAARAAAERSRLHGTLDPGSWALAAEACERIGVAFHAAECRYHEAAAVLATGGSRTDASEALGRAYETAARLRAEPLREAVVALARRARIDLGGVQPAADGLDLGLTAREREVLALLADGRTNREIGEALFISEKTASVHVSNILGKLGVGSRGAAAAMAVRLGFGEGGPLAAGPVSPAGSARRAAPCARRG